MSLTFFAVSGMDQVSDSTDSFAKRKKGRGRAAETYSLLSHNHKSFTWLLG